MTPVEYTQITVEHEGPVAVITLNRPQKLNAWTPRMAEEQAAAIHAASKSPARPTRRFMISAFRS